MNRRRVNQFRYKKAAKQREGIGVIDRKKTLKTCFLNVDGLGEVTLENIRETVNVKNPDLVILVETKRRAEEIGTDIDIPGYGLHEVRRSDLSEDKDGGGIAVYTKLSDGLLFNIHTPNITNGNAAFVMNERVWITVESESYKTAICGAYLGCQYGDDRNDEWNNLIYQTIQEESFSLRSRGYRIVLLGDFNGHVGDVLGVGVPGNKHDVNANGQRFLDFLAHTDCVHINGSVRVPGRWDTRRTSGMWTRQRAGVSSIIDFGVISAEHIDSVIGMTIDDRGEFGTQSDHNWLFLDLCDKFVRQRRLSNKQDKKSSWNIKEDQDWTGYNSHILHSVSTLDLSSPDKLASSISASILSALHANIGLKSSAGRKKPRLLPPDLVREFRLLRNMEKRWKSLNSECANAVTEEVTRAENQYLDQKKHTDELFFLHRAAKRPSIIEKCKGGSPRARKNFWSYVSPSKKQNSEISAVLNPVSGVVHCNLDDIVSDTEEHLLKVYQGSFDKIVTEHDNPDHSYASRRAKPVHNQAPDHPYSQPPSLKLPKLDSSSDLQSDPAGWLNSDFSMQEVKTMIKQLKNGKAKGWDTIPNEALKNLPDEMIAMLAILFNKIKNSGSLPEGWNRGRITLVHKYGARELLGNYRPITVNISMSGLYSKVLNERLTQVVEEHKLLGEVQNGFRKDRGGADNNFILDTILWKAKALKSKVHMAFLDISKAYDSVNRDVLWKKRSSMGFGGRFLSSLKSLYTDDCVDCMVNGRLTRPIFLRRGLRQGCSLSPMLFALYISEVGLDISSSGLGFRLGNVVVSGLLFADDLALVTRSGDGLMTLLDVVKSGFDKLRLTISHDKSQIVSPDEIDWKLVDNFSDTEKSLKQVSLYKYLGLWVYSSMYKTVVEKQKQCIKTAQKYKGSCIHVSRMGPDIVDVVHCTWVNVAIPAILNGCEAIPFCETNIYEIEKIQSQVAKFALGLPQSSPNFCAQTELGWKTFRQQLYERQIKFYFRVLYLNESRWVHQALLEHLAGSWKSPYLIYISSIRTRLGVFSAHHRPAVWKQISNKYFLSSLNKLFVQLPWLQTQDSLHRLLYVCENKWSTVIAEFRMGCEGLGNKQPRSGYNRKPFCPVCPQQQQNTGIHLLFSCSSLSKLRSETGISSFLTSCSIRGVSLSEAYRIFINGLDSENKTVSKSTFLERGKCMDDMRQLWLTKW